MNIYDLADVRRFIFQLVNKNDWRVVTEIPDWLWVYDHLPLRMRLIVGLRMQGFDNKKIARNLKIKENTVCQVLIRAKKRFIHSVE